MKKSELQRLFTENPQRLIDEEIEFEFKEIVGRVKMVDGIAAGEEFIGFQFVTGPYIGKTIYCGVLDEEKWLYETNVNSDGFLFNIDKQKSLRCEPEESSGDFIPELNGKTFTLKK